MFNHQGWPERGADVMRKFQTRVVESYGSIRAFEAYFAETDPKVRWTFLRLEFT
jgi:hypothetical protein